MSSPRSLLTKLAMIVLAGFLVAMLVVLRLVGRDLQRVEEAHRDSSSSLALLEEAAQQLRVGLQEAEEDRARLAEGARRATEEAVALRGELTLLQARVKAIETAQPTAAVAPPQEAAPPAPDPKAHRGEVPAAQRDNPPAPYRAASRALKQKGLPGFCGALGIDGQTQARFREAYERFLPQVRAADKAHANVTIKANAVVIAIEPYPEEGHALHKAWEDLRAQVLTPAQREAYINAYGDAVLFKRPFGHYTETITLTGDALGVKLTHTGSRVGGAGPTFETAGTLAGQGAVDKLPWLHLLPDEAVARLRGRAEL